MCKLQVITTCNEFIENVEWNEMHQEEQLTEIREEIGMKGMDVIEYILVNYKNKETVIRTIQNYYHHFNHDGII